MKEFEPMWKRVGVLGHRVKGCMDCKRIAYDELTGKKPFRTFLVHYNNFRNEEALLHRKFGPISYKVSSPR